MRQVTRRELLAGIGATGLAVVGLRAASGSALAYPNVQQLSTADADLRVSWREEYNGQLRPGTDDEGPILTLDNVQPGDEGTLAIRLELVDEDGETTATDPIRLTMAMVADDGSYRENGINEPEQADGDTTADVVDGDGTVLTGGGELQDYVDARVWYDVGWLEVFGASNGRNDGEPVVAEGTLREVIDALADGRALDADRATPTADCFAPGDELFLGMEWSIDRDVGDVIQGDSVEFDIAFTATACDGGT